MTLASNFGGGHRPIITAIFAVVLLQTPIVLGQQKILFHGADAEATFGADGAVFDFLEAKLGAGAVTYQQGDLAPGDGSGADGFDAVIISSSLGSGTVRNKYEDVEIPLLNWEQALTRQAAGEFNLSVGGRTNAGSAEIDILTDHFITSGLEGTIEVVNTPQTFSLGTGDVAEGVQLLANLAGTEDHAIMVAEKDAPLLGDGTDGSPDIAPARRAFLFLEDNTFAELNEDGLALFDRTVDWLLFRDLDVGNPGDFNNDGVVDLTDFGIMAENFNQRFPILESFAKGDQTRDGKVDLADFVETREIFLSAPGGTTASVPEPAGLSLAIIGGLAAVMLRPWRNK